MLLMPLPKQKYLICHFMSELTPTTVNGVNINLIKIYILDIYYQFLQLFKDTQKVHLHGQFILIKSLRMILVLSPQHMKIAYKKAHIKMQRYSF